MKIKGKVIGGALGVFGGLPGIVLGALVGHFLFDQKKEANNAAFDTYRKKQGQFVFHAFTLCAKMAKLKGSIGRPEITFMERLMKSQFNLNKEGREEAIRIWNKGKESAEPITVFASYFYNNFRVERHQILNMMDLLFAIAAADGHLHPAQERGLQQVATIFQINRLQYNRIKQRYFLTQRSRSQGQRQYQPSQNHLHTHYQLLGASSNESLPDIKKKYRALALKWHPDKVEATGASEDAVKHAEKKFQEINEAFEAIQKSKK